jgi:hypothetical protein
MKKSFYIIPLTALMLAACSDTNDMVQEQQQQQPLQPSPPVAVNFDTYMGKVATTRGGAYGSIDTEVLKKEGYGFGVFAYKTGTDNYLNFRTQNGAERRYPNFMYNEQIVYSEEKGKWVYATPANTKYWPNEVTDLFTDDQNNDASNDPATTEGNNGGLLSFFAYAPYTQEAAKATDAGIIGQGLISTDDGGILAFSTPNFNGGKASANAQNERYRYSDPFVKYKIADSSDQQVDLLWATTVGSSENVLSTGEQPGVSSEIYLDYLNDGTPIANDYTNPDAPVIVRPVYNVPADLTKQKTNGTVNLLFKHALAKVGGAYVGNGNGSDEDPTTPTNGLMVILDIDKDGNEFGGSLYPYAEGPKDGTPYNTKVTINEIVLHSERQLTSDGMYAIKNDLPFDYSSAAHTASLHNTGIFNLVTGIWTNSAYEAYASTRTERTQTIVPSHDNGGDIDQSRDAILSKNLAEPSAFTTTAYTKARFEELPVGVTTVAKNVYENDTQPFVFIPGTYPIITITIDYTVRSYDAKLADNYTEVRQRITKRLYILDEIQLNKQYNILMHLGLTSVKFTASVSDWEATDIAGNTAEPTDGTSPVTTFDGDEVEHVWLPINVAALNSCSPSSIADFPADGGTRDLGVITFTYDDGTTHTSKEKAMTFAFNSTEATVAIDQDETSPTYGHVSITLPANDTPNTNYYRLTITYGANSVTLPVKVLGKEEP